MKKFIKNNKLISLLILVFIILLSFYVVREIMASRNIYNESYLDGKDYNMIQKKYGVNEYSPMNISDERMAEIYLNDFKQNLFNDINSAYYLLNEEYRNLKFVSIENFINYINTLNYSEMEMEKYSVEPNIITVYTKDGKEYIFKINSVMEYEVYFDDYTIEI
jgi:hypothetical protein